MAPNHLDKPPTPGSVDMTIHQHRGSTVAIGMMPKKLQASKAEPTPALTEMIEMLTREKGSLSVELAKCQKLQELGEELQREVDYVINRLKMAVITFRKGQKDIKRDFEGFDGIDSEAKGTRST